MRRPRVIIIDDEIIILKLLKHFLSMRGYEVLSFSKPIICPIFEKNDYCSDEYPCADIVITDFKMPRMNGIELLQAQTERGCKLTIKNKAIISAYLTEGDKKRIEYLGYMYFEKPFDFTAISCWLDECEKRIDLSQPLGDRRREPRHQVFGEILYFSDRPLEIFRGFAVDISGSGICIKTSSPLVVEQSIIINSSFLACSQQPASVRWTQQTGDGSYMAGLLVV